MYYGFKNITWPWKLNSLVKKRYLWLLVFRTKVGIGIKFDMLNLLLGTSFTSMLRFYSILRSAMFWLCNWRLRFSTLTPCSNTLMHHVNTSICALLSVVNDQWHPRAVVRTWRTYIWPFSHMWDMNKRHMKQQWGERSWWNSWPSAWPVTLTLICFPHPVIDPITDACSGVCLSMRIINPDCLTVIYNRNFKIWFEFSIQSGSQRSRKKITLI